MPLLVVPTIHPTTAFPTFVIGDVYVPLLCLYCRIVVLFVFPLSVFSLQ